MFSSFSKNEERTVLILWMFSSLGMQKYIAGTSSIASLSECISLNINLELLFLVYIYWYIFKHLHSRFIPFKHYTFLFGQK